LKENVVKKLSRWGGLVILVLCASCASATGVGGGDIDARVGNGQDPDAATPPPGTPDAGEVVIVPDANPPPPGTPDAAPLPPDAAPPPGMCNLVTGAGCAAPTPACDLGAANEHACRQVLSPGTTTSTCSDATSCATNFSCIGASATASSCMRYCAADSDCGGTAGALCVVTLVDGGGATIPNVTLCSQACGPLDASGCPSTWACRLGREPTGAQRALTQCTPSGAGGRNATCADSSDCQAGFQCLCTDASCTPSLQKCKKICNATANTGCPTAGTCGGFSPSLVIGGTAYGACP
jgi:hypothetical protein